jgi:hypothetical protein
MNTVRTDLLSSQTTTGDGPIYDNVVPFMASALQLEISGAPTQVVVTLYGLINGSTWAPLAVLDTAQGYLSGEVATLQLPALVRQVKANLGVLTGGTNPSVSAHFAGNM